MAEVLLLLLSVRYTAPLILVIRCCIDCGRPDARCTPQSTHRHCRGGSEHDNRHTDAHCGLRWVRTCSHFAPLTAAAFAVLLTVRLRRWDGCCCARGCVSW